MPDTTGKSVQELLGDRRGSDRSSDHSRDDAQRQGGASLLHFFRHGAVGGWSDDKWEQVRHFTGVPFVAIKAIMDLVGGATFQVVKRKKKHRARSTFGPSNAFTTVTKALPTAHAHARDDAYTPLEDDGHPLARLTDRPNPADTFGELVTQLVLQNRLTGVAPLWCVPNRAGKPVELWALKTPTTTPLYQRSLMYPDGAWRVQPYTSGGMGGAWAGSAAGGLIGSAGAVLPGEEVKRFMDPHPFLEGDGFSPLSATAKQLDVLEAIDDSRHATMENGISLNAVLIAPGLPVEELARIDARMTERHAGARNAGRLITLAPPAGQGPSDKTSLTSITGQTAKDMDYQQGWDQMVKFCLAVFGVPPSVAGLAGATSYSELYAALRQFHHRQGAFVHRFADWLTKILCRPYCSFPGEYLFQIDLPTLDDPDLQEKQLAADVGIRSVNQRLALRNLPPVKHGEYPEAIYLKLLEQDIAPKPTPQPAGPAPAQPSPALPGGGSDSQPADAPAIAPAPADNTLDSAGTANAPQPDADPLAALLGADAQPGAEDESPAQPEQPDDGDDPDGVQDAVTRAALASLGIEDDAEPVTKAVAITKPGGARVKRNEGEVWTGGDGKKWTKHNGKIVAATQGKPAGAWGKSEVPTARPATGKPASGQQQSDPQPAPQPATGAPPVKPGHVRLYHGGLAYGTGGKGGRWVSGDPKYAQGYADKNSGHGAHVQFVDVPESHPAVKTALDGAEYETGRRDIKYAAHFELPEEHAQNLKPHAGQGGAAPSQNPAPQQPTASLEQNHDALVAKLLAGRPSIRLLIGGAGPTRGHTITDGPSLKAFLDAGGQLPGGHYKEAAKSVPAQTPQAKAVLSKADQWADKHAEKHADRVAAHFGISRDRAKGLLVSAIRAVAAHAAEYGTAPMATLRDPRTGRTVTLTHKPGASQPSGDSQLPYRVVGQPTAGKRGLPVARTAEANRAQPAAKPTPKPLEPDFEPEESPAPRRGLVGRGLDHALKHLGTPAEQRLARSRIAKRTRAGGNTPTGGAVPRPENKLARGTGVPRVKKSVPVAVQEGGLVFKGAWDDSPELKVVPKGAADVAAALRDLDPDDLNGLRVEYHPDGPKFWIDQMDWHDGVGGKAVIAAAEKVTGEEAQEGYKHKDNLPDGCGVYVFNEGPNPPGDGWIDLLEASRPELYKALPADVEFHDPAPYGYCPECRAPGVSCERRIDGNACCANGHEYPRSRAKYASTQVEITGAARRKLLALGKQIDPADLGEDGIEDEPHVSALFGTHVGSPAVVAQVVRDFGPVTFTVGALKAFRGSETGRDYDVLYAEVDSPDLHRLHAALKVLPHTLKFSDYKPHATIAYLCAGLADKYLATLPPVNETITATALTVCSAKREHTSVPLTGGAVLKAFKEEDHPRDDHGHWVEKGHIEEAKSDPAKADALRAKVNDPEQRKKLDALIGSESSSEPRASRRAKSIADAAARIEVTSDRVTGDAVEINSSRDYDEVADRMTEDERDRMESKLTEWRDAWVDERMDDYDPDRHLEHDVAADDAGWTDRAVSNKAKALIDDLENADEVREAAEEVIADWYKGTSKSGEDAVDQLADQLAEYEGLDELAGKVRDLSSGARDEVEEKLEEQREALRAEERSRLEGKYDSDDDRIAYLREFFDDHEDEERFKGASKKGKWGVDEDGDRAFLFDTSNGGEYKISVFDQTHAGHALKELVFSDAKGKFTVTGAGGAHEVFSAVSAAATALVTKEKIPALSFTAAEESRQRLYDRLVRTVAASAPDYAAVAVTPASGPKRYLVVLRDQLAQMTPVLTHLVGSVETLVKSRGAAGRVRLPDGVQLLAPATAEQMQTWVRSEGWPDGAPVTKACEPAGMSALAGSAGGFLVGAPAVRRTRRKRKRVAAVTAYADAVLKALAGDQPEHSEGQKFQGKDGKDYVIKDGKAVHAPAQEGQGAASDGAQQQTPAGQQPHPEATQARAEVARVGADLRDGKPVSAADNAALAAGLAHLTPEERKAFVEVTGHKPEPKLPPSSAELESARLGKVLHPNVQIKHTASGDWVVKGRHGKLAAVQNEAVASELAQSIGLNVPRVHAVKVHGQDAAAVELVKGTALSSLTTPEDRRAALAKVPRNDVEHHALFGFLIGEGDANNGNFLISPDNRLVAIDKEQSLRHGTNPIGDRAEFRIPFFLADVPPPKQTAGEHQFHPQNLAHMAEQGAKIAEKLKAMGRAKDAVGVERRTAVLKQLAATGQPVSAADIDKAGRAYDKSNPQSSGLLGRLKGWFGS